MLQSIREGAQGFLSWVILILISVPFALWGIQNYFEGGQETAVVTVNDREFYGNDVSQALQSLQQRYSEALQAGLVDEEQLKQQAIDSLVLRELLIQTAAGRGMVATDEAVRSEVQTIEAFQTENGFDKQRYQNLLAARGMSSQQFAGQVRQSLMIEQLQKGIQNSAFVSRATLEDFYRLRNQERGFSYFIVPTNNDAETTDISEESIKQHYNTNAERYQTAEKVSVEYIELALGQLMDQVEIDEEALLAAYEEQQDQYAAQEKRKVSHILFVVEDNGDSEFVAQAEQKAIEAKKRLGQGESFADLAKELSDDPGSAETGGSLGVIERGAMDQAFEEAAWQLSEDEVSEPVRSQFGFHLVRVDEIQSPQKEPFEKVREEILLALKSESAEALLYEKMEKMAELSFENPDSLTPVAEQLGLTVQETGLFTREQGEGIADDPRFRNMAFSDEVLNNQNSEPLEISSDKAVVMHLKRHEEAGVRGLDEVRDQIVVDLRDSLKAEQAEKKANELLEQLKKEGNIQLLAQSSSAELNEVSATKRDTPDISSELLRAVFQAAHPAEGKPVYFRVRDAKGEQLIVALQAVTDGDIGKVENRELELARNNWASSLGEAQMESALSYLREQAEIRISASEE